MSFYYTVEIHATFSREEADLIYDCVKNHPDTSFQALQGGCVFSFVNYFKGKPVDSKFDIKQLDTFLKALELPLGLASEIHSVELKSKVEKKIIDLIKSIRKETEIIYEIRK